MRQIINLLGFNILMLIIRFLRFIDIFNGAARVDIDCVQNIKHQLWSMPIAFHSSSKFIQCDIYEEGSIQWFILKWMNWRFWITFLCCIWLGYIMTHRNVLTYNYILDLAVESFYWYCIIAIIHKNTNRYSYYNINFLILAFGHSKYNYTCHKLPLHDHNLM